MSPCLRSHEPSITSNPVEIIIVMQPWVAGEAFWRYSLLTEEGIQSEGTLTSPEEIEQLQLKLGAGVAWNGVWEEMIDAGLVPPD